MSAPTHTAPRSSTPAPVIRRPPRVSTVTAKVVMAGTGTVFTLFVVVHLVGNLKVYLGAQHFDDYAHWLRTLLEPLVPYEGVLWVLRVVLAVSLVAHLGCGALLWRRARRARGAFRRRLLGWRTFSARTMPVTGIVLLLFLVFHILDLTTGTAPVASGAYDPGTTTTSAAYANLVASFDRPAVSAFYLLAMAVLGLHLLHGLWSVVNDLGVTGQRSRQVAVVVGGTVAGLVFLGNASIPIAVLTGLVS
ncbi:MAG: putative succinate dehydrogenase cytochrome b subunit [Modestobacter sp.]|nr:putative succinate dehydrogenase cytochrome b subunit [Modestobacter sp.]MCW2508269.1 putative succinate dehydrogenase cytochrome b subunit [Modestobacter sp.]MCW2574655.1 putative succinate dehydrogenase cytochrome b subunit [Modestobacter sp.]